MRESGYLLPVYTAWKGREIWAFVVMKDFSFSDFIYTKCKIDVVDQTFWVHQDVNFFASLQEGVTHDATTQARMNELSKRLLQILQLPYQG